MVEPTKVKYVPILKWRQGEKVALKHLDTRLKDSIIPLIELVNDGGDSPDDLPKDLANHWPRTVYLDVYYRPNHFARTDLDSLAQYTQEVDVIPVIRLNSPPLVIDGIKQVMGMYNNGVAIRIAVNEGHNLELLKKELDLILAELNTQKDKYDLIIDFGYLTEPKSYRKTLEQVAKIVSGSAWRRVIVASGMFPSSLTEFTPNADNFLPRAEWELWLKHKDALGIETIFSDYSVRNPGNVAKGGLGSVSVRYTLTDRYQIFRGTLSDKFFKYLVHAYNIQTLYGEDYKDSYSWGDSIIHERAAQLKSALEAGYDPETYTGFRPGNKTDWVAVSVNHHIAVVLKENLLD